MTELSNDAKAVLGAWFGMMNVDGDLHFAMQKVRPTERAKAALDECVSAGWLSYSPAVNGGHTYILVKPAGEWLAWMHGRVAANDQTVNFKLVERIEPAPALSAQGAV